jgi:hypothetical protein
MSKNELVVMSTTYIPNALSNSFSANLSTTLGAQLIAATTAVGSTNRTFVQEALTKEEQLLIVNIRLIIYGYMLLPLTLIGLGLNGFTIVVLLHPKMRNFSTNAYLTALSIANIVCLINFIFLYSFRYILSNEIFKKNVYHYQNVNEIHPYESFINLIYGIWSPIFTTFQLYAIYLTCAVTVDRWIYLTWPLKIDIICSMKNTLIAIILLFVFCVVYNLPRWFEIETKSFMPYTNDTKTIYQAQLTKFGKNEIYNLIMLKYGYMIFVYGIPFFVLLIVNIGIIRKLIETKRRKSTLLGSKRLNTKLDSKIDSKDVTNQNNNSSKNSNRKSSSNSKTPKQSNSNSKLDPKMTLMVLAVVLAFFLCQFPYLIIRILAANHSNKLWFHFGKAVCDFLAALNCCVNFLIYCFFGQNFRQIAKSILLYRTYSPSSVQQKLSYAAANRRSVIANKSFRSQMDAASSLKPMLHSESAKTDKFEHQSEV